MAGSEKAQRVIIKRSDGGWEEKEVRKKCSSNAGRVNWITSAENQRSDSSSEIGFEQT